MIDHAEETGGRYIIVIQSVVCYNFSVVDSDKSEIYGEQLSWS